MSEIKKVKVNTIIESQIPEFLNEESPLFKTFLDHYYLSLTTKSGAIDLATNLKQYKDINNFINENLSEGTILSSDVLTFDDEIFVQSTNGWPEKYGLLKIDNEIITYSEKTLNSFKGCSRGFSGIDQIKSDIDSKFLNFITTEASEHVSGSTVFNLSNLFILEFFEKFKNEFLPGFEGRNFVNELSVKNILRQAKDFYTSKGTDTSYKVLFKILYGKDIEIIKPQDFTIIPSSNSYFTTKNILVEKISGGNPLDLKGNFLYQSVSGIGTVSASVFNVEIRPVDNKFLYEISLDSTSLSGNFQVTGKTKILENVEVNSDTIIVDSTIGFSKSGKILVTPPNSTTIQINYQDKTVNQFLGVSGVTRSLDYGLEVTEEKFAFGFDSSNQIINFRIVNVIDSVDFSKTSNLRPGDTVRLSGFGKDLTDRSEFNSWIYNIPTEHKIKRIDQPDIDKFRIFLFDEISFFKNEELLLVDNAGNTGNVKILDVEFSTGDEKRKYSNRILVQLFDQSYNALNSTLVRKVISKASHGLDYFENINKIPSGVQNTYLSFDEKSFYVTSTGLPNYPIYALDSKKFVEVVGTSSTSTFYSFNHQFTTGENIFYKPSSNSISGLSTGFYFITSIDRNQFSLSFSKSDLFSQKYISVNPGITSDFIIKSGYQNKTITNQKLFKKFNLDKNLNVFDDKNQRLTNNREIGLLANGVELLSPTLFDENIYFGDLVSIEVTNSGKNYDVVNPPPIEILDESGSGAKAHVNLTGEVREVKVISPGIGYQEKPKITITGGNGTGCVLESNLVKGKISVGFKPDISVSTINNTITFLSNHNLDDGEEVTYDSSGNSNIDGLINGSTYFVGVLNNTTIKLYKTFEDSINKSDEIDIVGISSGFHKFQTLQTKNTITKIYVKDPGSGYSNRTVKVPSVLSSGNIIGINTYDSYIYATKHGFNNGDLVIYSTTGSPISGLSTTSNYYVKVLDVNRFKLSEAGIGTTSTTDNFVKNKFIKFDSTGVGTHSISYPPIQVSVETLSAIGSTEIITPVLEPIVLGSISDVYLEDGGLGYGCTNIINFQRTPNIGISSIKSQCLLSAIVVNGSINDVKIINRGNGYRKDSEIIILGSGKFANIEPIIENGQVISINIIDGGVGYGSSNTLISVVNRGIDAKFLGVVREWKINQVVKSSNIFNSDDDGIIYPNKNVDLGLQFVHFYIPKKLRYQLSDNFTENNKEKLAGITHSPILGYAYDGNPIYGPYGYDPLAGGSIRQVRTSYELRVDFISGKRPPGYSPGYFVNDYVYTGSGDLDEYNGRFCLTPQFPNGTYAYFVSINVDATGRSTPAYPYAVGPYFKSKPIVENFLPSINQDVDLTKYDISRNIGPYYLNYNNSYYNLIDKVSENYKQEFRINEVKFSGIDDAIIFSSGKNYQVGDRLILDNENTSGSFANIVVSRISGQEVSQFSVVETSINDVVFDIKSRQITGRTVGPHQIRNGETITISGISTITSSPLEGSFKVTVSDKTVELLKDIPSSTTTGISTFIFVKDTSGFNVNDTIGIGTEILIITGISSQRSGFYVNRMDNLNLGIHSVGIVSVRLLPDKFNFLVNEEPQNLTLTNYVTFFDPKESLGVGTNGITRTISLTGIGTTTIQTRYIPERSIYIPNHKFFTGQELIYNPGVAGTSLFVSNIGSGVSFALLPGQTVYAVNLGVNYVGLSTIGFTSTSGIGTNLNSLQFSEFTFALVGSAHSLTTVYPTVTGKIERFIGIVTTTSNHDLTDGDQIKLTIDNNQLQTIKLFYNPIIRKILINSVSFNASDVSVDEDYINIPNNNLSTGDKVLYFSENPISGLANNSLYFVSKVDSNRIKLCQYRTDIDDFNFIDFTTTGSSNQTLYWVNPPIKIIKGDILALDLSDESLLNMDIEFYEDLGFQRKVELVGDLEQRFAIIRDGTPGTEGAFVYLNTANTKYPSLLYYNLVPKSPIDERKTQITTDLEVFGANKIVTLSHILNNNFNISVSSNNEFTFNLTKTPSQIEKLSYSSSNISYTTNSLSSYGPIDKLKINFAGRGYKKLPSVSSIVTKRGQNAVIKLVSPTIGKVESFDRIKDGFDYPTDPTLTPSLSVPTIVGVKDIRTIDSIGIVTGGKNYNSTPQLIVKEDPNIILQPILSGGSITNVNIINNVTNLREPLEITTIYNSNGYDIDFITVSGSTITLELLNTEFITSGYSQTDEKFPFEIGDEIFIEGCRLTPVTSGKANYNSSSYGYKFFTVTGINTVNYTVTYDMSGISTGDFGIYDDTVTSGYVVNRKDIPVFEMILNDDVEYKSSEIVVSKTFSAVVMENGWDNDLNQLRLNNSFGVLNIGDKIFGERSKIQGTVEYLDTFNLTSTLGVTRDKVGQIDNSVGILNEYLQRMSDNFYYQKFSYSIKSEIDYDTWRESVRSIIHPSGFREFSDLVIYTKPSENEVAIGIAKSENLRPIVNQSSSTFLVNIDNLVKLNEKNNFTMVYEEDFLDDGSVERVFLSGGINLKSFILNKTNKVLKIDDISDQFDGTSIQKLEGRYADASYLLNLNKSFIQEEVVGFITATYPGITTNPDWNREIFKRDVGFIIDAVSHDTKYNSNNKSIETGLIGIGVSGQTAETIEAFKYIGNLSKFVINNVGVQTSYQLSTAFSISNLTYDNITGIATITTTAPHLLTSDDYVVLKNIVLSCNSGSGFATAIFPNLGSGPDGNGVLSPKGFSYPIEVVGIRTFTINPGVSTISHVYNSGGTVQKAFVNIKQEYDTAILFDSSCSLSYSSDCCSNVVSTINSYIGIITSIIGIGTTSVPEIILPSKTKGGIVVGLSSFVLKNNQVPLFQRQFSSSDADIINLELNSFNLQNHNFQSGQELVYSYDSQPIGIATTSYVDGEKDVLMVVGNFDGTAIFENGYNVGITTTITGISTVLVPAGPSVQIFNDVMGITTTGGTGALFDVFITYSNSTGQPLSTSIVSVVDGGYGYNVGDVVSIAGTYLGGLSPTNDLSFVVSATYATGIQTQANNAYLSVPSNDINGALFDVYRDNIGRIEDIKVSYGGSGYSTTSIVSIAGSYIGGVTPTDDVIFEPIVLGVDKLPTKLFVNKVNDGTFRVSGLSTSVFFDITSYGSGNHSFKIKDPNPNVIIGIDGIIQSAVRRKSLVLDLDSEVSSATTTIVKLSSGISSISVGDIINLNSEFMLVKSIGVGSTNSIEVDRSSLGTQSGIHTVGTSATIFDGDFNIVGDTIYFTSPPYGKIGPENLKVSSIFSGRVFSRQFDPSKPEDKNIILDDISLNFTGIAATEFTLKSSDSTTTTLYNQVNSDTNIDNNPIILINNVFQEPRVDYTIDGSSENAIKFLSGAPNSGKVSKVAISTGFGYLPLYGAKGEITSVGTGGSINGVILNGFGQGYIQNPAITILSTNGTGAILTTTIGAAGTITSLSILDGGSGYLEGDEIQIGIPTSYSNLGVEYVGTSTGIGEKLKVSVTVGQGSSIIEYRIDNQGVAYKVGDKLTPIGILTNSSFRYDSLGIVDVKYDNLTGVTTVTTDSIHNINENDYVILSGIAFTCGYDEVGIQTFSYDNVTGICTVVTYSPHGLLRTDVDANKTSDEVFLFNLPFSCAVEHSGVTTTIFPDGTSTYGRVFPVLSSVGLTTFTMNAGISTIPHIFEGWPEIGISTFSYYEITGLSTVTTIIDHEFQVGDKITLAGLAFTCDSTYAGLTTTIFPDGTSQYGYTFTVTSVNSSTEFEFLAGISTIVHYYTGGGYTKKVPTAQRVLRYTDDSSDGAYDFRVTSVGSTNTFTIQASAISSIPHYYTQSGIVTFKQFEPFTLTVTEIQTDSFSGFYPGQFVLFDDISPKFNGTRKKFTLTVTKNNITEALSLKTLDGSDLDITNNIFIYLNDILQVPGDSYTFFGSRVTFKEAPKQNSTCTVLYYRGSSIDVEEIEPPKTIKIGDTISIKENKNDDFDTDQFERTVKTIVASDQFDTFLYNSLGINTDSTKIRPLSWSKQTYDRIINGNLYSKSRPSLSGRILPNAYVIKSITPTDESIYVNNAFPIFSEVDNLGEDLRDLIITDYNNSTPAIATCIVSSSSSITSVVISDGGSGYSYTSNPIVTISKTAITKKDPIKDWKPTVGIPTTYDLNSVTYGNIFVSVGSSSVLSQSVDGQNWISGSVGFAGTVGFNAVSCASTNIYLAVGEYGFIVKSIGYANTLTSWNQLSLVEELVIPGLGIVGRVGSSYTGSFNAVTYSPYIDYWVAVGFAGSTFTSPGIGTEVFVSRNSNTLSTLKSVTHSPNSILAVGDGGTIISTVNGQVWDTLNSPTFESLNKIVYVNGRYIIGGNNGTLLRSSITSLATFEIINNNLTENIIDIYYSTDYDVYSVLTSTGELYYSFDLTTWVNRSTNQSKVLKNIIFENSIGLEGRVVSVGMGGTAIYSDPIYNRATAQSSTFAGVVTSITIIEGGFGYSQKNPPAILIEPEKTKTERIRSFKVIGDYGNIIGVNTFVAGTPGIGTTTPKIEFVLKSETYDNSTLGIGYSSLNSFGVNYSQLSKGDYFVITDSNVLVGHALTGITTSLGGMSNYPNSRVGTAVSFLDGVYRVENVTSPDISSGIVTITCNFAPKSASENFVQVYVRGELNSGINTNNFYGRYSWSKIFDYQNRVILSPQSFETYNNNGISGITSNPFIFRTRQL